MFSPKYTIQRQSFVFRNMLTPRYGNMVGGVFSRFAESQYVSRRYIPRQHIPVPVPYFLPDPFDERRIFQNDFTNHCEGFFFHAWKTAWVNSDSQRNR